MRACTHTPRERASERGEREGERERERGRERARERERVRAPFFQVRPAHHIVSARQAYAHLPCFLRPGYPLPPRPSETLQRSPDVNAPPPRPRRHRVHPSTRHPRPPDPGPRMPPPQRRRVPARYRTVPRPRAWDARACSGAALRCLFIFVTVKTTRQAQHRVWTCKVSVPVGTRLLLSSKGTNHCNIPQNHIVLKCLRLSLLAAGGSGRVRSLL